LRFRHEGELIHQYGAWIMFALVFLESIGLPLPGEAIPGERCDFR
jgi:membrane protein DedA with SNARE-associated domain